MTYDEALDRFNDEMSNAVTDKDRTDATTDLAIRIGDAHKAESLRDAWMQQYNESLRESN